MFVYIEYYMYTPYMYILPMAILERKVQCDFYTFCIYASFKSLRCDINFSMI